jgi:excisionase family DNA binding protein
MNESVSANDPPKLAHSIDEAGLALGISRSSVYALIKEGRLRVLKLGRRTVIPTDALQALVSGVDHG